MDVNNIILALVIVAIIIFALQLVVTAWMMGKCYWKGWTDAKKHTTEENKKAGEQN